VKIPILLLGVFLAPQETAHLTIATSTSAAAVAPGRKVSLLLDIAPKSKMHVYAPGQQGYLAVTLTLEPDAAFTSAKPKYPAPEKIFIKVLDETQLVYTKPFRITEDVTVAATTALRRQAAEGTPLTIKGTVRYQACEDAICYRPATVPVQWTVTLATTPARRGSGS
jgi:DsbC/DsbD-like thiol-disulfide interchange protein